MKTAYLLFGATLIWLITFPMGAAYLEYADYTKNGTEAALIKRDLSVYRDVVIPSAAISERKLDVGFAGAVSVYPGFHLIHDPDLGNEVIAKGPENVLQLIDHKSISDYRFNLEFNQAVKLNAPVEVRMNLNAHHVGNLQLVFIDYIPQDNWTNFSTLGPLTGHDVSIGGRVRSENDILVDVDDLKYAVADCTPCAENEKITLAGRAGKFYSSKLGSKLDISALEAATFQRTFPSMSGRTLSFGKLEKLNVIYDTNNGFDTSANYSLVAPDTFLVSPKTEVKIQYRSGESLVDWDKGVIIRE